MQIREQMEALIEEMLNGQIMLSEAITEFEKLYIQKALCQNNEHYSNTANALGIHRNTLSKRIAGYQAASKPPKRLLQKRSRKTA
jgi:transcriptional regulator with PAS, ATPase and Fis domain